MWQSKYGWSILMTLFYSEFYLWQDFIKNVENTDLIKFLIISECCG